MVGRKKVTIHRNHNGNRIHHNSSYLDIVAGWDIKRILIGLALALLFVVLPMYMFSAEPYDFESVDTTQPQVMESDEKFELIDEADIKEVLNDNADFIENHEKEVEATIEKNIEQNVEENVEENAIPVGDLSDQKKENELSNSANTFADNKDQESEKIRAEAIAMLDADNKSQESEKIKTEAIEILDEGLNERVLSRAEAVEMLIKGKHERALSYDELSEAIRVERRAKSSSKNEEPVVDIDISDLEPELDDSILSVDNIKLDEIKQFEIINNTIEEKKGKLHPSDKLVGNPDVKNLATTEITNIDLGVAENIKLEEIKITPDVNLNSGTKKEVEYLDTIKTSAKILGKDSISRAFLTTGLKDKEPVDNIESLVIVNNKVMTKIYYFTEILNMEGEVLYHYWMWDGKIEFEKEIKIWGNRWRASTLKMIPYSKTGQWQARIVNEEGDILNEIKFDVVSE